MKLTERLSFRREFITTPLIFLVFLALFSKVNYDFQSFIPSLVQGINSLTARLSVLLLTMLNINAAVDKSYILLPMHSQIEIIYECTGVYILLLFVSFILSYPTTLPKKLTGIFFGVPLLYSFNIFRIAVLGILEIFSPAFFDFFHLYLWEATFIAFVLLVAYCWIIWIAETGHTISGRQLRFIKPIIQFAIFSILFFILIRLLLNPYSLLQQRLLKAILASDLFTLKKTIEISAGKGILWLQEQNGASQPIYLTHLTFNLVPFLALTMLLRLSPFSKIIGMIAGALLILMSQIFWLTVIALRVITPTPGILTLFNLYQMFNLALPILLWVPLLYLSRKTLRREEHRVPPRAVFLPAQGEPLSYPRLSSTICYLLLGVVTPVVLLFSVFQLRLGYFVALIIWFLGAILILPEPPFILQMKNRKRSVFISLLLFWQVPFTAATLTYLPPHQRVGLIHPSGKFTLLGEGIHFRLPLKKKEVLFELSTRSFSFPVLAYSQHGGKVIDAEARVYYRITPEANFETIYHELGKNMAEIDQGVSSLCRTATIWTLSRSGYLRDWQKSGAAESFHLGILSQARTLLGEYRIAIEKFELTNREGAQVKL